MATTFKPTGKVPYTLAWIGKSGNVTTDPVTDVVATTSDLNVATVVPDADPKTGFVNGNPAVTALSTAIITFKGKNSLGEEVDGAVVVTVDPGTIGGGDGGGTVPDVAGSIGIVLGDEVPQ